MTAARTAKLKNDPAISRRISEERQRLGWHLNEMAAFAQTSIFGAGSWQRNVSIPAEKLALLALRGFDTHYILTGIRQSLEVAADPEDITLRLAAAEKMIALAASILEGAAEFHDKAAEVAELIDQARCALRGHRP